MGIICPDLAPFASFITLIAAALCQGNRLIVIPSENFPLPAVDMYQIFDTSDVPSAAINIVTGKHEELIKTLSEHNAVDGIWNFGDPTYESDIDIASISNQQLGRCGCSGEAICCHISKTSALGTSGTRTWSGPARCSSRTASSCRS